MTQKNLNQLLKTSLPTPEVPEGLEARVLQAVHTEQQRELVRWRRFRLVSLGGLAATAVSSLVFVASIIGQSGTQAVVETLMVNRDVLPLQDTAFALLETLPLGGIAATFVSTALLCLLLSIRLPKQRFTLSVPVHA